MSQAGGRRPDRQREDLAHGASAVDVPRWRERGVTPLARRTSWHPTTRHERRLVRTLAMYVATGSHKEAAHQLDIAETTCRQRVSQLMGLVGARNAAQAVWLLREELEKAR